VLRINPGFTIESSSVEQKKLNALRIFFTGVRRSFAGALQRSAVGLCGSISAPLPRAASALGNLGRCHGSRRSDDVCHLCCLERVLIPRGFRPFKYRSFLDFTVWANLAHGALMIPRALGDPQYHSKFLTDIPWILGLSFAILILMPLASAASVQS